MYPNSVLYVLDYLDLIGKHDDLSKHVPGVWDRSDGGPS
jgi:hypothetical protein